jgi:hypothetical protein
MLIAGSVLGLIVVAFLLFHWTAKRSLDRRMMGAVSAVQAATYKRLLRRYEAEPNNVGIAGFLAAAVTNELFGQTPTAEKAIAFKTKNATMIAQCLSELQHDQDLCAIVTDANRIAAAVLYPTHSGKRKDIEMEKTITHLDKLITFGILVPNREAPQLKPFIAAVHRYYDENVRAYEP